ncbi:MAG: hypothetical protein NC217_03880 [Muribaculaceae bacterium]|nr:hypothetical protein [Muribaculaceae bacterium]
MKSQEELLSRFEDIESLPVSEEMLGAYFEGSLEPEQMAEVYDAIVDSDMLQDLTAEIYDIPEDIEVMDVLSPDGGIDYDVPVHAEVDILDENDEDVMIASDSEPLIVDDDDVYTATDCEAPIECDQSSQDIFDSGMDDDSQAMIDDYDM